MSATHEGPVHPAGPGLAIESATAHVEVLVAGAGGETLQQLAEEVGHGHTRRLAPLAKEALARAGVAPRALAWVAADLGPGSFTGVRAGLASAEAFALAAGARLAGASSLAALAHGARAKRALVVPLVPAGRRDLYAGFFRADARGAVSLVAAPRVGTVAEVLAAAAEALAALGSGPGSPGLRFVGPGAAREQEALEAAWRGSTSPAFRFAGLSALDLAGAALSARGPAAGLPAPHAAPRPLYVRSAQAEERVRHRASAAEEIVLRDFAVADIPWAAETERRVFSDPWPESFFRGELAQAMAWTRVAERGGCRAGYLVAWLGAGTGHLGNLAVVPEARRRGVARALLEDLLARARALETAQVTLEVRVSNFAAQALYRAFGFRLAGLRRGYYGDTGEDALIMEWTGPAAEAAPRAAGPADRGRLPTAGSH